MLTGQFARSRKVSCGSSGFAGDRRFRLARSRRHVVLAPVLARFQHNSATGAAARAIPLRAPVFSPILVTNTGKGGNMRLTSTIVIGLMLASPAMASPEHTAPATFDGTEARTGLLSTHVDRAHGRILFTLPPAGADGVSARFLFTASLRTGLRAAPTMLDRGRIGNTQVIAFRRMGKKVAAMFENPRFRATGADPLAPAGSSDFATSVVWMGAVVATLPDGSIVIDISEFLTEDVIGIADSLYQSSDTLGTNDAPQGAGKGFHREARLSAAIPESLKVFPENIEVDALQTYVSDVPGDEVSNIAPEPKSVGFPVH